MSPNSADDEYAAGRAVSNDVRWMRRAAELARSAGRAGCTPVGSVIVLDGRIIAEAEEGVRRGHRSLAHAEFLAVEVALASAPGSLAHATLYSTVEPCILCGFAIREAGIGRVVMDRKAGEIGAVHSIFPVLTTSEIKRWGTPPQVTWWSEAS